MNADKLSAYQTLYKCLRTVALLMAPVAPFYADRLYADLTGSEKSVHLQLFPEPDENAIDKTLEESMHLAQVITSMVLALRRKADLKVRQPLQRIMVPATDAARRAALEAMKPLILSEVNVKELEIVGEDGDGVLVKRVKPDFRKLGPKHGRMMKQVAAAVQAMNAADIAALERDGSVKISVGGTEAVIDLADVEVISEDIPGWLVANEGNVTVALDVTVTPELRREGIARDIVNRIQNIRKSRRYEITDRINLRFAPSEATDEAINEYADYICRQVLAVSLEIAPVGADAEMLTLDDLELAVDITPASPRD